MSQGPMLVHDKLKKRRLWLVVISAYNDKNDLDYIRNVRKGFNTIFCTDDKREALRKLESYQGNPNPKLVAARVTSVTRNGRTQKINPKILHDEEPLSP